MTTTSSQTQVTQGYVSVAGHPTWYSDSGSPGEPVLLLHGGLSHSDAMLETIGPALSGRFRVMAFDRRGHGRTADTGESFHYMAMAAETAGILGKLIGGPAHLVGWSDGGIVALLLAIKQPDLVRSLVLISVNYDTEGWIPNLGDGSETGDSPMMETVEKSYAERSPDGQEHFDVVAKKSAALWASEPTIRIDELRTVLCPTLVIAGDDDLIALSHTASLYESLPAGQLAIVPGASHALVVEKPQVVGGLIADFLTAGQPQTLVPVRRRG